MTIYTQNWPSSSVDAPHMRLVLVEPPINEPLSAAEAKARLSIGDEISDQVMDAYITAARQRLDGVDGYLGRALITQTWLGNLDYFPACDDGRIYIPLPPLQEVSQVSYLDSTGMPVVVATGDYQVVMGPRPYIVPVYNGVWPSVTNRADAVTIEFVAGYGDDGDDVPEPIRTAIALGAGHFRHMTRNPAISQEVEEGIGSTRYIVNADTYKIIDDTIANLLSTYRVIYV